MSWFFPLICFTSEFKPFSVDPKILQHMIESESEFLMEVTNKTKGDLKARILSPLLPRTVLTPPQGGTLVDYDGSLRLLELGQVPLDHVEDFKSGMFVRL